MNDNSGNFEAAHYPDGRLSPSKLQCRSLRQVVTELALGADTSLPIVLQLVLRHDIRPCVELPRDCCVVVSDPGEAGELSEESNLINEGLRKQTSPASELTSYRDS